MTVRRRKVLGLTLLLALVCCDEHPQRDEAADAGRDGEPERDAERDAGTPDCYQDPESHRQIINACTDAERIDKQPELPQLLPDGLLPPLP
jgi:hypothetical protein